MSVNRDKTAADLYRKSPRDERAELVLFSASDTGYEIGLLRSYQMADFRALAKARATPTPPTRAARITRKSSFYAILARIAVRGERINKLTTDGFSI